MNGRLQKVILTALWLPICGMAVTEYTPLTADPLLEPWRWRHEEALDGLGVVCMDEAPDGSLWFGGPGLIAHYDGITVTQIPFDDALMGEIQHWKVNPRAKALTAFPDGSLLALIGESLVLRKDGEWKVLIKDVGISVFTMRMERAEDGSIWLIVPDGLWHISPDLTRITPVMKASSNGSLGSFALDAAGNVWVCEKVAGSRARLVKIPLENQRPAPPSSWKKFPLPFQTDATEIRIVSGKNGFIWYADDSHNTPLATFDPTQNEWIKNRSGFPKMRFFSLSTGRDGTIWAGGEKEIFCVPLSGIPHLYTSDQLQLPQVPLAVHETSRRLWVIGRVGYVYSVDVGPGEWKTYEKLNFQCEAPDGKLWFKSSNHDEAVVHDPQTGTWRLYNRDDGLIDTISAIRASSHLLIWAVGSHDGRAALSVFDGQSWTRFKHPEFASFIEPRSFMEAADGSVWFGAGGPVLKDVPDAGGALQYGVDRYGSPYLIKHHAPPGFPYFVTALAQSPDHIIHVGSTAYHSYDPKTKTPRFRAALQGMNTVDIVFDRQQNLWLAKEHAGIYRQMPDDSWKLYTVRNGLAGVDLSSMILLHDGSLLAASGQGISRFDGKTWTKHAFPAWWSMSSRWSGIYETSDGAIWFNCNFREAQSAQAVVNRTERFYTIRHYAEKTAPDTRITDYLDRVAPPGNAHVQWSARDPWSNTPREALQFSWRLDRGEWSPFSYETSRTFLNLSSGTHMLDVRARDRAFNVDPTPDRITFYVIPPIWKQGWFITLISVFTGSIALLIWFIIRNRERYLLSRQAAREAFLMEKQQEREKHLAEIDRLKTGFFTNISHELRTPLTVISGRLESIMKEEVDKKRKTSLSIVLRNVQRLSTLVSQLLDFRKIGEGKLSVNLSQGDLIPVLNDWMASLQVLAEQSHITCTLVSAEKCTGRFDFDKLQKIFTNLISNSIKYTQAGGKVRTRLSVKEDNILLTVEDTGIGIEPEHLGHIFDRFYRVPESSMAFGAGIGLDLTRELVDLLGGTIRAESPIHKDPECPGTRFTVTLPFKKATASDTEPDSPEPAQRDGSPAPVSAAEPDSGPAAPPDEGAPVILVVEDDADIREYISQGLEGDYRVVLAENGRIGLEKAKQAVPDLIVTDIMMPEMSGVEMCRHVKKSMETSHIPVVMLTAQASVEHQMEGLKTGADDYITKPFNMDLLTIRIANLLESRRKLRERFINEYSPLSMPVAENAAEKVFLDHAETVMEEHYSDFEFRTDQFAAALNMSLRSMQRKFKAVLGRTPREFINEFRMAKAAELLVSTSKTIAEISFDVGIDEPTNFTRLFKSHVNMTPSQYRAEHHRQAEGSIRR